MWTKETENPQGVIVIVHGAGEHHGRYEWLIKKWLTEGYNVVIGDLPGQGTSTRRRGHIDSFDQYIETIEKWVERAAEFDLPVHLIGHSMGGLAVIRSLMEKKLPVSTVILSSPSVGLESPPPKGLEVASVVLNKVVPGLRLNSHLEPGIATRNEEIKARDMEDNLLVRKVSVRWYRELVKAMKIAVEHPDKFPDLPLLVMQGGADAIVDKDIVLKWFNRLAITDKSYKEWDGLYHEVFNEPEREEVFYMAKEFINVREHLNLNK
ncbi:alpha/beta hydrolase [Pseudalkalibacillus caeni]|uniref:Alpha/beta hydrolase n=1 Tax=Exobacillus caeni TaxID=2574798 RepID=A0A5R9FDT2_9BACL|nr:alpha/beta hydrolase [Pseudalkalibacillus caeni]TLS39033.1 alpha/beta hydrolase [Pseudalkalibacillus caeni]